VDEGRWRQRFSLRSLAVDRHPWSSRGWDIATRVPGLPLPAADSITVSVDLPIGNTGARVALAVQAVG
jgi:hypothetical protein